MFDRISDGIYWDRLLRLVDGCSPCSPGCEHCWSARYTHRFDGHLVGSPMGEYIWENEFTDGNKFNRYIKLRHDNLELPLRTKKPQAWLILNDLFHKDVHRDFILKSFIIMRTAKQHIFLVLTKRIDRAEKWINEWRPAAEALADMSFKINRFPNNIWLGVTVCGPDELWKIEYLLQIPAAVRWISYEPALGPVDFLPWLSPCGYYCDHDAEDGGHHPDKAKISWIVMGGETGPGARSMHPDWVRSVRDQCQAAGMPFFFKQWGEWIPAGIQEPVPSELEITYLKNMPTYAVFPDGQVMQRIGKKLAGRLLDGREWNELPEVKG